MLKKKIAILLATYNSEMFIKEQIESLLSQTYSEFIIYVRDDGSIDNTINILRRYEKIVILDDPQKHKGAMGSFMWLLENVEAEYYMFCDHDDVWKENKIELTFREMVVIEQKNPHKPIVVNTDLEVVDKNLNVIHPSMWKYNKINPEILKNYNYSSVCNAFTGCTMMINHLAKDVSMPISKSATMHDYWIALKVIASGGVVGNVDHSTIKYRQHGGNVVGSQPIEKNYFLSKVKNIGAVIQSNKKNIYMLNDIKKVNIANYLLYKLLYYIKR